jgi:hypothetical protein
VINAKQFPDATMLHDRVCEMLMYGSTSAERDWAHGTEVGLHNVALHCSSFDWDFDLKRLWIPPSRWTMMVRQYLNRGDLDHALDMVSDRLVGRGRGIAVLRTQPVMGRGNGRNVRRRWGSCMLNLSYRNNPVPTVSLHSRTTYFGYLAALDITVAHVFARACANIVGIDPADMDFVWTMDLAQFHGFRSLAWALGDPGIKSEMDEFVDTRTEYSPRVVDGNQPGWRKALDGYNRIVACDRLDKPYGDEKFSSFNRVRRRFHTEVMGVEYAQQFAGGEKDIGPFAPLPSVPASSLTFDALRPGEPTTIDYDEEDDDE